MSEFLCNDDVKLVPHTRRLNLHVLLRIERASAPKAVNGGGGRAPALQTVTITLGWMQSPQKENKGADLKRGVRLLMRTNLQDTRRQAGG